MSDFDFYVEGYMSMSYAGRHFGGAFGYAAHVALVDGEYSFALDGPGEGCGSMSVVRPSAMALMPHMGRGWSSMRKEV